MLREDSKPDERHASGCEKPAWFVKIKYVFPGTIQAESRGVC